MKLCTCCGLFKPFEKFHADKYNKKDGRTSKCTECTLFGRRLVNNSKRFWGMRAGIVNKHKGGGHVSGPELAALFETQNYLCPWCGIVLEESIISVDHKNPSSRGGNNNIDNLAIICQDCNHLKADRTDEEFAILLPIYINRFKSKI